ncbi:MAG: GAF domain-containing sensor histidine kinase [Pseudohaliea sp.]
MQAPPLPADERQRLRALADLKLLDTLPEERFDRLTRLARRLFDVPIALVSLVDEQRQWFKSRQGLDACETARDISFCGYAILDEAVFLVGDASEDPRFADNPLVTGAPHIRFYAGAPLHTPQGYRVGTLCLIDRRPRALDSGERAALRDLADCVEDEINLLVEKQLRARLASSEERLRALFDLSPIGIALNDYDSGAFLEVNDALLQPSGYTREEFIGLSYWDLTPAEYGPQEAQQRESLARTGRYGPFEKEYLRKDGSRYPVRLNGMMLRDDGGRKLIWSMVEDISERRRAERIKSEFVATVSHELRTPLTSITGALGLLAGRSQGELPEPMRQLVDTAYRNGQRLSHLINDLLDFEKISAGKLRFEAELRPLVPLLEQALENQRSHAAEHGVALRLEVTAASPEVRVDARRLEQVLANLLSNAIKFSPRDAMVRVVLQASGNPVRVAVIDRGPGIPAAFRGRIFERFSQADSSDTRQRGGTGLGLAITRELLEHMGGRVGVDSVEGEGATFWFELPAGEPALRANTAAPGTGGEHR